MKQFKLFFVSMSVIMGAGFFRPAFAGDAVTIVYTNGVIAKLRNGYQQVADSIREFNRKGTENFLTKVTIEGETFFINLGDVALICRDECKSLQLKFPEKK